MKRVFALLLVFVLAISTMLLPCSATAQEEAEILYMEDGGYIIITTETYTVARASNTIGGIRHYYRYSADDVLQWTFTLDGQFRYTPGVEAVCTRATCSIDIINTNWQCTSKSATPDGATAVGNATVEFKVLTITANTVRPNITITCDTYGNLS